MYRKLMFLAVGLFLVQGVGAFAQSDICIPQFLDGIAGPFQWRTTLVLQNQEQNQAQVQLHFYDNNGAPMHQFTMNRRSGPGGPDPVGPGGQFDPEPIRARAALGYRSGGEGGFQSGSVMIRSQDRIRAHAHLQLHDFEGNILSETSINPGPQFRFGSFYADRSDGAGVGLALANPSETQTAVCILEIFAEDDTTVLGTTQITLGPHSQTARYLFQLFPDILTDGAGYVRITCDNPVCALALHLRGLGMTQIPVVVDDLN